MQVPQVYLCDKFTKITIDPDEDGDGNLISNLSPVIDKPRYLGQELSLHLSYKIDDNVYVKDLTLTAIQSGSILKWSESPYLRWEETISDEKVRFDYKYGNADIWVSCAYDEHTVEALEFSINGTPVNQR